ncbi:MAG: ATP-binding protein [Spirochaetia bacterium]|nr:ATP-binding protein [Spirochaetia bacterium]
MKERFSTGTVIENTKTSDTILNKKESKSSVNSVVYLSFGADLDILYIVKNFSSMNLLHYSNTAELIDALKNISPGLFIMDLESACRDNYHAVKVVQKDFQGTEVLITVGKEKQFEILNLLDLGITQFLRMDDNYESMLKKLQHLFDRCEIKHLENIISNNHSRTLKKKLEWMNYKNIKQNIGIDTAGKNIIENLRDSLVQVGGYGVMLSMIDVIKEMSEKQNEHYIVDAQMIDILSDNAKTANKNLNGINKAINIMSSHYELDQFSSYYLIQKIPEILDEIFHNAEDSGNSIYFPKINMLPDVYLNINYDLIAFAIEELTVNAVKYTNPGSPIHLYANVIDGYFSLNMINEYSQYQDDHFDESSIDMLVKPFLRMHPPLDRDLKAEKIGMGLGLTVVYYIMGQMNGILNIKNVLDHTNESVKSSVLTQLFLPISS